MNQKISVIIPVYNLEKYLSGCLDSVLCQTYKNFEVIAVNDGSTDASREILDRYAQQDARVVPVHIKNGGVSNARNIGLDNATGEYVYFLDGDDTIEPYTLELLYGNINGFDLVQTAYDRVFSNGQIVRETFVDKTLEGADSILGGYFLGEIKESSCNKLYHKALIGDLRFDTNLRVAEDSIFVHTYIKKAKRVKLMTDITYHYYIHGDSCMHSKIKEAHFYPMVLRDELLKECKGNKTLYKKWVSFEAHLCFYLIRLILINGDNPFVDRIQELRQRVVTKKQYILFSSYYTARFKSGVVLLWLCPKLFYKIYSK